MVKSIKAYTGGFWVKSLIVVVDLLGQVSLSRSRRPFGSSLRVGGCRRPFGSSLSKWMKETFWVISQSGYRGLGSGLWKCGMPLGSSLSKWVSSDGDGYCMVRVRGLEVTGQKSYFIGVWKLNHHLHSQWRLPFSFPWTLDHEDKPLTLGTNQVKNNDTWSHEKYMFAK